MNETIAKILFVINHGSGSRKGIDWNGVISNYFENLPYEIDFFLLPCDEAAVKLKKKNFFSKGFHYTEKFRIRISNYNILPADIYCSIFIMIFLTI